jgi:hypothetical protein
VTPEHSPQPVQAEAASARAHGRDAFPPALTLASLGSSAALVAAALGLLAVMLVRRRSPWERCEIALSRQDGDGTFYARALRPKRSEEVAATSPVFRSPTEDLPEEGPIRAAHRVIVQRLAWDGWAPEDGRNGVWWKLRFRRPVKAASTDDA